MEMMRVKIYYVQTGGLDDLEAARRIKSEIENKFGIWVEIRDEKGDEVS